MPVFLGNSTFRSDGASGLSSFCSPRFIFRFIASSSFTRFNVKRATALASIVFFSAIASNAVLGDDFLRILGIRTTPLGADVIADPLPIDPRKPNWKTNPRWAEIRSTYETAAQLGIEEISIDFFWGLVQTCAGQDPKCFNFDFNDMLLNVIEESYAKYGKVPRIEALLSAHQYGHNVGDFASAAQQSQDSLPIHLPGFYISEAEMHGWGFKSEAGNWNFEAIPPFADHKTMHYLVDFYTGFRNHYAPRAHLFSKIIAGMFAAGEVVYPSYHYHDRRVQIRKAEVPGHGVFQWCSPDAVLSLQRWLKQKYKEISALNTAWGSTFEAFEDIGALEGVEVVDAFLREHRQYTQEGQDRTQWYRDTLFLSARKRAEAVTRVFDAPGSPFQELSKWMKFGSIHWIKTHGISQLTAGVRSTVGATPGELDPLLRQPSSWKLENGGGYREVETLIFDPLRGLQEEFPSSKWGVIFTCGEMGNCDDHCRTPHTFCSRCGTEGLQSWAHDLVHAFATALKSTKIKIENALQGNLYGVENVRRMLGHAAVHPNIVQLSWLRAQNAIASVPVRQALAAIQTHNTLTKVSCPDGILSQAEQDATSAATLVAN